MQCFIRNVRPGPLDYQAIFWIEVADESIDGYWEFMATGDGMLWDVGLGQDARNFWRGRQITDIEIIREHGGWLESNDNFQMFLDIIYEQPLNRGTQIHWTWE